MSINEAIKKLRRKTASSQQVFATSLGISIRALVNYERGRTPPPRVLAALAHLAAHYVELDLIDQFWSALPVELQQRPLAV